MGGREQFLASGSDGVVVVGNRGPGSREWNVDSSGPAQARHSPWF